MHKICLPSQPLKRPWWDVSRPSSTVQLVQPVQQDQAGGSSRTGKKSCSMRRKKESIEISGFSLVVNCRKTCMSNTQLRIKHEKPFKKGSTIFVNSWNYKEQYIKYLIWLIYPLVKPENLNYLKISQSYVLTSLFRKSMIFQSTILLQTTNINVSSL